jgi:hypothetical protein
MSDRCGSFSSSGRRHRRQVVLDPDGNDIVLFQRGVHGAVGHGEVHRQFFNRHGWVRHSEVGDLRATLLSVLPTHVGMFGVPVDLAKLFPMHFALGSFGAVTAGGGSIAEYAKTSRSLSFLPRVHTAILHHLFTF